MQTQLLIFDLDGFFTSVIGGGDVENLKPEPDGVFECLAACPGMISTVFHDTFTKDAVRANVANDKALKREGGANEVADTVAYLTSSESSFLTGVNLDINGGLYYS